MRAHEFTNSTPQDLQDVAEWLGTTADQLQVTKTVEPIDRFLNQIKEMYASYDEFPEDADRTNRIVQLIKGGEKPEPVYVEAGDPTLFVMEGRHRMVAFWLLGMKTIPVAYVSKKSENLTEKFDLNSASEEEQIAAVDDDSKAIRLINNPSEAVQIAAIQRSPHALRFIDNPSEVVKLTAVKEYGPVIAGINNPSEAVQLAAIQSDPYTIRFIKNPTEAVQLAAIEHSYRLILGIENPASKDVVMTAMLKMIKDDGYDEKLYNRYKSRYPDWPEWAIIDKSIKQDMLIKEAVNLNSASEEEQIAAVNRDGNAITYIRNPSEAVQLAAVKNHSYIIRYIKNPSEAVQAAAIKKNPYVMRFIQKPVRINDPDIKSLILKPILTWVKEGYLDTNVYSLYKKLYPEWPEWTVIDKAVRQSNLIKEAEAVQQFYHGSSTELPVGTVLTPRDNYETNWSSTDFYAPLEKYRPKNQLAHKQSVFMCDNPDDVDLAGGATDWLFTVEPQGPVQRHDLNWGSEISMLIGDGYAIDSPEVKRAAENYWAGVPHEDENVWEYLTPAARIIAVEPY